MKVLAKFRLWEKAEREPYAGSPEESQPNVHLKFSAVKDEIFGPYTPAGTLDMTVIKKVGDLFQLKQEYYLTFEPVTEESTKRLVPQAG